MLETLNKGELEPKIIVDHLMDLSPSVKDFIERGFKFKSNPSEAIQDMLNGAEIDEQEKGIIDQYISAEEERYKSGDISKLSPTEFANRYPDLVSIKEKINNSIVPANR